MTYSAEGKADRNKNRNRSERFTQPDSVGVHHGGFWSRRPRFESESGYFSTLFARTAMVHLKCFLFPCTIFRHTHLLERTGLGTL